METSRGSTVLRLQPYVIIDGISEPLHAADVSLGRLDALVPKEELDLFDLAEPSLRLNITPSTQHRQQHRC